MIEKPSKKEQIWMSLFFIIPVLILSKLNNFLTDDGLMKVLYAGLFGGVGGAIGYGLYFAVKSFNSLTKVISLILLTVASISAYYFTHKLLSPTLLTCEICGFIAVGNKEQECAICGNNTWEIEKTYKTFTTKYEWIRDEQLSWFAIDSLNQQIDFYKPQVANNYSKDNNWRPSISGLDILNEFKNIEK